MRPHQKEEKQKFVSIPEQSQKETQKSDQT